MSEDSSQNSMAKRKNGAQAQSVSELLSNVLEPVLARRTGMTLDLLKAWPEMTGPEFSRVTRPQKINWPRRAHEDDPFEPATLVVACEPSAALFFQHEQAVIIERVNQFFGFEAIKRVQIVQKPVSVNQQPANRSKTSLPNEDALRLTEMLEDIDSPELRETLEKLGRGVISDTKNR